MRIFMFFLVLNAVLFFNPLFAGAQGVTIEEGKIIANEILSESSGEELLSDQIEDDLDPDNADAKAAITATTDASHVSGEALFYENEDGLIVKIEVSNVPNPGKHGIHVHENGSCADSGNAAGSHFNPHSVSHGFYPDHGSDAAHTGDMGNIDILEDGSGKLLIRLPGVSLKEGIHNIMGKAVILHEKEDDFGQPTGNAGGRIGCGLIVEQL